MKSIFFKVDDKIKQEMQWIQLEEGLGNQTATVTFLVKYYLLTKKSNNDLTLKLLEKTLEAMDVGKIPPLEEQLKSL